MSPKEMVRPGTIPERVTERTAADVLRAAADLIEPEGRWTRRAYARTAAGVVVPEYSPHAVCWCMSGAIWRAAHDLAKRRVGVSEVSASHDAAVKALPRGTSIAPWNDAPERTQAEVVAALRLAADQCDGASSASTLGNSGRP